MLHDSLSVNQIHLHSHPMCSIGCETTLKQDESELLQVRGTVDGGDERSAAAIVYRIERKRLLKALQTILVLYQSSDDALPMDG